MEKFVNEVCDVAVRLHNFKTRQTSVGNFTTSSLDGQNKSFSKETDLFPESRQEGQAGDKPVSPRPKGESYLDKLNKFFEEAHILSEDLQEDCLKCFEIFKGSSNEEFKTDFIFKLLRYKFKTEEGSLKGTRILFHVLDDCMNISKQYTYKSKGSKSGGGFQFGDYDMMTVLKQITVRGPNEKEIIDDRFPVLTFEEKNTPPGFVHLKIPPGKFSENIFIDWGTPDGELVSNRRFKDYFKDKYRIEDVCINGPCVSSPEDIDHLFCLHSNTWPSMFESWFRRPRMEWPPIEVVDEIKNEGVIFVPKGVRIAEKEFTDLEWCFSLDEDRLVKSFNPVQMLCYTILKFLKRDIIDKYAKDCGFQSYFIKTTMFWMCEEFNDVIWKKTSFHKCLFALLNRLCYWVKYGFCPNYFVPAMNLLDNMRENKSNEILKNVIRNALVLNLQYAVVLITPRHVSLSKVLSVTEKENPVTDQFKSIVGLLKIVRRSLTVCTYNQIIRIRQKVVSRFVHKKLSYFVKGLYALIFCYSNQIVAQMTDIDKGNKKAYRSHKRIISMLLQGSNADAMTGWLLLATYFHQNRQYVEALFITQCALERYKTGNVHLICDGYQEDRISNYIEESKWNTKVSLLKRMKSSFVDLVFFLPLPLWCIPEMKIDVGDTAWVSHPQSYSHFIKLLCFYHLKLDEDSNNAMIEDLKTHLTQITQYSFEKRVLFSKVYKAIDLLPDRQFTLKQMLFDILKTIPDIA